MSVAARLASGRLPLVLPGRNKRPVLKEVCGSRWIEIEVEVITRATGKEPGGADQEDQRVLDFNYCWETPPKQPTVLQILSWEDMWMPLVLHARERAFESARDIKYVGVERDLTIGRHVMESIGMAVCLYLASHYSTEASMQRAVVLTAPKSFMCGFEFHHMWMLAEFFQFDTVASDKQYAYANMRIPKYGGSVYVVVPTSSIQFRRSKKKGHVTGVGSMHLSFVVWRICVGNGTVTVESGQEVFWSAQRWAQIVRDVKHTLLKWHKLMGKDAGDVIDPLLLQWARPPVIE